MSRFKESSSFGLKLFLIFLFIGIIFAGFLGYQKYQDYQFDQQEKLRLAYEENQIAIQQQRQALGHISDEVVLPKREENRVEPIPKPTLARSHATNTQYKCDGRTHCSQMRSYEEAVYFINHCPSVEMDGDGDGIPCERQFGR